MEVVNALIAYYFNVKSYVDGGILCRSSILPCCLHSQYTELETIVDSFFACFGVDDRFSTFDKDSWDSIDGVGESVLILGMAEGCN